MFTFDVEFFFFHSFSLVLNDLRFRRISSDFQSYFVNIAGEDSLSRSSPGISDNSKTVVFFEKWAGEGLCPLLNKNGRILNFSGGLAISSDGVSLFNHIFQSDLYDHWPTFIYPPAWYLFNLLHLDLKSYLFKYKNSCIGFV